MLATVHKLITNASNNIGLTSAEIQKLLEPDHVHRGKIYIKMDDGHEKEFDAFRIQHNNKLGPYKGGIRFHPKVDDNEVKALATIMSLKCALSNLPLGGGKGGVAVDPKELSETELQRLSRAYVDLMYSYIGVNKDIPAPDVNTNPKIMSWMVDEYLYLHHKNEPKAQMKDIQLKGTFTGKDVIDGGTLGRVEATGRGGVYVLLRLLKALNIGNDISIAVQGFGNVGYYFALLAQEAGCRVVAISDSKTAILADDFKKGIDIIKAKAHKEKTGSLSGFSGTTVISNEHLLELPVEVLVPSALENVIHKNNADKVKAKIVVSMANGPITFEAYEVLGKKDVIVVPDVLANAGGVIVSYLEWYQNLHDQKWSEERVNVKLKELITAAFDDIWALSRENEIDLTIAAYQIAIEKITK